MDRILQRLGEINTTLEVPSDHFRGELLAEREVLESGSPVQLLGVERI